MSEKSIAPFEFVQFECYSVVLYRTTDISDGTYVYNAAVNLINLDDDLEVVNFITIPTKHWSIDPNFAVQPAIEIGYGLTDFRLTDEITVIDIDTGKEIFDVEINLEDIDL